MPRFRLVPEQLEVTSFTSVTPAALELERAAFTRFGEQTCGGMSCDYACKTKFDATCPNICY
jgi:hypothetical protein